MKGCLKGVLIGFGLLIALGIVAGITGGGNKTASATCAPPAGAANGIVPSLIKLRLDDAKKRLCSRGFGNVKSTDAMPGLSRDQWDDSNWVIVSQLPNPESSDVSFGTTIALGVVKDGEVTASGNILDTKAKFPCTHFRNVEADMQSGVLTDAEARQKLKEVHDDSAGSIVEPPARAALAAATSGTPADFVTTVNELSAACGRLGY